MKNKNMPKAKQTNYEDWFASLPLDKQMYVAQHVRKKIDKIHADTTEIIDSCYIGAMIEVLEMNLDDCIKVAEKANVNMKITEQILNKEGEKYYMKVNNEELRNQIRAEAKAMLKSNPKESTLAISRELAKEYDLPPKDIHIIVAEARKELKGEKEVVADQEINIEVLKDGEKVNLENTESPTITFEEASKLEVVTPVFKNPNKPKPQIKTIIEWQYGTYIKSSEGVKLGDKLYKDVDEVLINKTESEKLYEDKINLIDEEIEKWNKKRIEIEKEGMQELEKYAEIEQIFAM